MTVFNGFKAGAFTLVALAWLGAARTANAAVINISGTQNGEQAGDGNCHAQDLPCENGALINPVQVTFAPGTYTLSDAYSPTTGYAPGALYDAWNFEAGNPVGWVWNYNAFYDDGSDGSTIDPSNYYTYLLFNVNATTADRRTTEAGAAAVGASTPPSTFTVSQITTIDFVVNDYYLPDNAGGVSLNVQPSAVPEVASWAMMLAGGGLVGFALRRRAVSAILANDVTAKGASRLG